MFVTFAFILTQTFSIFITTLSVETSVECYDLRIACCGDRISNLVTLDRVTRWHVTWCRLGWSRTRTYSQFYRVTVSCWCDQFQRHSIRFHVRHCTSVPRVRRTSTRSLVYMVYYYTIYDMTDSCLYYMAGRERER